VGAFGLRTILSPNSEEEIMPPRINNLSFNTIISAGFHPLGQTEFARPSAVNTGKLIGAENSFRAKASISLFSITITCP